MRDPELVARAQRAATRLESAWEQWRALHGLADAWPADGRGPAAGQLVTSPCGDGPAAVRCLARFGGSQAGTAVGKLPR